jgi:hypothetical protein
MRTKTLVLTAALTLAGAAASMAQVYSQNIVGYVNVTYPAGFAIAANPLKTGSNTVAEVFPSVDLFTQIYKYNNAGGYEAANGNFGAWGTPGQVLAPGQAFFINFPAAKTITYVGEVLTGTNSVALGGGFNMIGCVTPIAGKLTTDLGLQPGLFDVVYQYSKSIHDYLPANTYFGSWVVEPVIGVAEGFWYFNANSPTNWTRVFNP